MEHLKVEHRDLADELLGLIRSQLEGLFQRAEPEEKVPIGLAVERTRSLRTENLYAAKNFLQNAIESVGTNDITTEYLDCQQELIFICLLQDPFDSVLRRAERHHTMCKSHPNKGWLYKATLLLGHVYHRRGSFQRAVELYTNAELLGKADPLLGQDAVVEAVVHHQLCLHALGQSAVALRNLEPLQDMEGLSDAVKGLVLYACGCVHRGSSDFQRAEEFLSASIQSAERLGDQAAVVERQGELSRVFRSTGDFQKALEYQSFAFEYGLRCGNIYLLATACSLMGFTYQYLRAPSGSPNFSLAVQYLAVGMQLSESLGDRENVGWCLNNIGKAYVKMKQHDQALDLFEKRLTLAKEAGNVLGEGTAYGNAGLAYRGAGRYQEAVAYHKQYLKLVRKPMDKAWMEHEIALDYIALGDLDSSLQFALLEFLTSSEIRSHYTSKADKEKVANFDKNQARCFNLLQYILVEQGKVEAALMLADLGRARAMTDLVLEKASSLVPEAPQLVLPQGQLNVHCLTEKIEQVHSLAQQLRTSIVVYSIIEPPLPDVANQRWLLTWVLTPTSHSIEFVRQEISTDEQLNFDVLKGKEHPYFDEVEANNSTVRDLVLVAGRKHGKEASVMSQVNKRLSLLYKLLITPIETFLEGETKHIVFVPQGSLLGIPYSALCGNNGYLVERFAITVSLSLHLLQLGAASSQAQTCIQTVLAVGNPLMPEKTIEQLKKASEEAKSVVETVQPLHATLLCEGDATKEAVAKLIQLHQIVHLATHAIPTESLEDLDIPSTASSTTPYSDYSTRGAIVLAQSGKDCSGLLTAHEIQQMTIPAELVVLSCCRTGQGRITSDGVLGLSRAFLTAGASAVVVTLWSIDDEHTSRLMRVFYDVYSKSRSAGFALQQAMNHLIQEGSEPGYWGAFLVIGLTPGETIQGFSHHRQKSS